jgi:membrane fusion protein, multidrug efflux system
MHRSSILRPALAAMMAAGLAACGSKSADANIESTSATVTVGPENVTLVERAELSSGPAISGTLSPEREAMIRAQLAGPVLSVSADQGTRVSAGTQLARIDDRTVRDAFLSARSGFTTAQTAADIASREMSRAEKLLAAGAIADRDVENARRADQAARSQLADAQARLTLAQKQLDDAQVRAPFRGVVSSRTVSAGDVVQLGAALFEVVDPSSMRLEAALPASQLTTAKLGAPVSFSVNGYPDRVFTGKITRVSPTADRATGQVQIVVSIPNERSDLVGGLFAKGRVTAATHNGLVAPSTAVDLRGLRPAVLRLKGGKSERIEVELGLRDEATERVEIMSGVAAGDTLLLGAAQGITPGTPVRVSTPSDRPVEKVTAPAGKKS